MARVLVAANSSWNIANFRSGLVRELLRDGHQVTTVSPDPDGIEIDGTRLPHRRCRMERAGMNPLKDLASLRSLTGIVRDERPHVFISFTIKPNIYGSFVCRLFGVAAFPNVSGLGATFLGRSIFRRTILLLYRLAFAQAAMVFFQNPDDRDLFEGERIVRRGQSAVLPGSGIDLSFFTPYELPRELRFLMIARLLGDKGVREYVGAARALRLRLPGATFSLLGELDRDNPTAIDRSELTQWVDEGVVDYLGSTADVRPFIRSCSAVVLPSYREGLPRTLLEGAATARPLIATDVPGCREVVRDGVTGFLCEARNADSLASAMERLAAISHDERARMGARARTMTEKEFDEAFVCGTYLAAVRRVL